MALGFKTDEIRHTLSMERADAATVYFQSATPAQVRDAEPDPSSPPIFPITAVSTIADSSLPDRPLPDSNRAELRGWFERGQQHRRNQQIEAAIACFRQVLALDPQHAPAYNNLGTLLQQQGQLTEAIACFERVVQLRPELAAGHSNLAGVWQQQGEWQRAVEGYQKAIQRDAGFVAALSNLGRLWVQQGEWSAALPLLERAFEGQPPSFELAMLLGNGYAAQSQLEVAAQWFERALRLQPQSTEALYALGQLASLGGDLASAEGCFRQVLQLDPDHLEACYYLEYTRIALCDWDAYDERMAALLQRLRAAVERPQELRLSVLVLNSFPANPALNRALAERYAESVSRSVPSQLAGATSAVRQHSSPIQSGTLRLGYLSPDFREHPVGILLHDVFRHHQRPAFSVTAYSLVAERDAFTEAVQGGCDDFVDLSALSPGAAAERIRRDGIDILIDLAGYTTHSRPEILARCPAPVQVSFLGYPGTLGAPFVPYLLADEWLIPPALEGGYSEQIIRLPQAFVASPLPSSSATLTRTDVGLPETGVVYACFNRSLKFDPHTFACWLRILQQVPGSVLWLREAPPVVQQRLGAVAQQQGIAAERLVFGQHLALGDYLATCALADVMLDNWHYSAASTAVCGLAAGVPLLTLPGSSFASRLGASVCAAAQRSEWICASAAEYEQRAVAWGTRPSELSAVRQRWHEERDAVPLFNPEPWVRHLETALGQLWQSHAKTINSTQEGSI